MIRLGQGFDVHAFMPGDFLIIGGVAIPYNKAFAAHSDGDVLLHAVCDALLGALALGDIGKHFPDNEQVYEGIDSRVLLCRVMKKITTLGYRVGNIDATIIAQAPKMRPYIDVMRKNIATDCQVPVSAVNIKATTSEKLGFVGRSEGIAAQAVCLVMVDTLKSESLIASPVKKNDSAC